jgi:sugar lactone lactonase YvrE
MIRKAWMFTALLVVSLASSRLTAQNQFGPPASGNTSAILFAPATLKLVAGLNGAGYGGDGGPANSATTQLNYPVGIAFDSNGNLFIADQSNHVVRRIDHGTGNISTFAGQEANPGFSIGGGVATSAQMQGPSGLVVDSNNNVYVADRFNNVVFKITPAGVISIFAGSGTAGYGGDGGSATAAGAEFNNIWGLGIDSNNNIYIADSTNNLIRKVTQAGNLSTFAGDNADVNACNANEYSTAAPPYTALQAHLCFPQGVAFDSAGNAYISDTKNDIIRKVDTSGNLTSFAGTFRTPGFSGDGGPATSAWFNQPAGLNTDPADRVYISDFFNNRIRVVDTAGNINTVFGSGFGSLNAASIGEPDTEAVNVTSGPANGIFNFVLDQEGNILATDSSSPAVTIAGSTGQYVFPEQFVFSPSPVKYITVENPSGVPLDFLGTPPITGPYSLATGASAGTCNLSGTLPAGETCTIGVIFTPIVDDPKNAGSLTLTTNANSSPSTISLFGMSYGTGTTLANLTGPSQSFTATVGQTSAAEQATLTNDGQEPITITSAVFGGINPTDFAVSSTTCPVSPATLASGASCVYNITFTPVNTTTATASFNVMIANYGQLGVSINGVGTAAGPQTATPVISPAAGTYNAPVAVEITDSTANSTIYYTTTGTAPVVGTSPTYSSVFTVTQSGTKVQAVATATGDTTSSAASPATYTVQPAIQFNPATVGISAGAAQQLTAQFSLAGTTAPTVSLHYGHDYTLGALNCVPNGSIQVCSVAVSFIPTLPGGRKDALFVMNGTTRLASVLLGGIGQAPLALVQPGVVTNINPTANYDQYKSAVDENGTVYVLSSNSNAVYSVTKAGVVTKLPVTVSSPNGVAIDGAGILYIAQNAYSYGLITWDTVQNTQGSICIVPPSFGYSCTSAQNDEFLYDVATDAFGNLFVLNILNPNQNVIELSPSGNYTLYPAVGNPGPNLVAVDTNDNVFLGGGDLGSTPAIEKIVNNTQTSINSTGAGEGLALDAAGTIYATRYSVPPYDVAMLAASNYATPLAGLDGGITGEIESPLGLGLGSDGTLYVGNYSYLDKVDRTQGAISFGELSLNTASSPQPVGIYNGGNENLTLSNLSVSGSGFTMVPATTNGCSANLVITPGQLCNVEVTANFPTAGVFSGTVTFTTNSLNTPSTTQTVNLSAFVYGPNVTASGPVAFGNQNIGTQPTMTVTLTNSGDLYSAGIGVSSATVPSGFSISGGTGAGSCGALGESLAPGASCTLTVTFSPTQVTSYSGTASISISSSGGGGPWPAVTFAVSGAGISDLIAQAITFTSPMSPQTFSSGLMIPLVATGGASGNPVVFTIDGSSTGTGTISGSTLTVTGAGRIVIDANQAGNSTYAAAPQVQQSVVVTQAAQAITFTQPSSPVIYSGTPIVVQLSATGGASGNAVVFSIDGSSTGTGSISGSALTVTGTGTIVINANQAGNTNYSAAAQVQRTLQVNAPGAQSITFTQPASPVVYSTGLSISLVATGGASGNPVVFTIDGSSTGNGTISGNTLTVTGVGNIVIDANQAGNGSYSAATQVQRSVQITQAPQTISFTQPSSPVFYSGTSISIPLTATGGGSGNPVVLTVDTSSTAGIASISGTTLTVTGVGNIVIDASQAGNANYTAAAQVQRTIIVSAIGTQVITFTQPTTPVTYTSGLTITLVATGGASGNPIVFTVDSTSTAGIASISGTTLTVTGAGTIVVDANQAGSASYLAAPQVQRTIVVALPPDFSITATPPAQSINISGSATYSISATSTTGNFTTPIVLSVSGLPTGATGTFSPSSVTAGGESNSSTLTVTTAAQTATAHPGSKFWPLGGTALALLLIAPMRRWRKFWSGRALMLLVGLMTLLATASLTACGGGFAMPITSQTYTLTITGTGGTDVHTTTVQLTVAE